jgi:protein-tyrosine phosphatase
MRSEMNHGGYTYLMPGPWLAQGSAPPSGVRVPFDVIVLAAMEYQEPELPGYRVMRVPLDDSGPPPSASDRVLIRSTAKKIVDYVRSRRRVLVTCMQGRNRSGVLVGLALREMGLPGAEAARRIRLARNGLTNPHFHAMVVG